MFDSPTGAPFRRPCSSCKIMCRRSHQLLLATMGAQESGQLSILADA